ncbi:MAG: hypothetical protein HYU69_06620 [Bacteroidetes bacterium]|nr:hypothetical protein [Bacteroidota bacterium]
MSKLGSSELFQLIKQLSKTEKRHFKVFASRHVIGETNKYVKLFDIIDKQREFDESELLKERFITQLPQLKNRLNEIILKSLTIYYSNSSVDSRLHEFLQHIKVLFDKGLFGQCEKIIWKAKEMANKYEKHLQLLDLLKWEIELMRVQSFAGRTKMEINVLHHQMKVVMDKYKISNQYDYLISRISMLLNKEGILRDKTGLTSIEKLMQNPLLKSRDKARSFDSLRCFYLCYGFYYIMLDQVNNSYKYIVKLVGLFEKQPHQITQNQGQFISALNNLLVIQLRLKKFDEFSLTVKKLRAIITKSKHIKNKILYISNTLEIEMHIHRGQFNKGLELVIDIYEANFLKSLNSRQKMVLHYNIAYIYFGCGNYSSANNFLNKILNDTTVSFKDIIYCIARILSIIVHFELRNDDLLKYAIISTIRFLHKRKRLYKFETAILNFLRKKEFRAYSRKKMVSGFKELQTELLDLSKDTFEARILEYFDFISWLDSKIENRSFAEIVKRKSLQAS